MEIPVTAGPWLVLGAVLGLLLALLVALAVLLLRRGRPAPPAHVREPGVDDLPGFLEFPPGTAPAPAFPPAAWPALSVPAGPPSPAPRDAGARGARPGMSMAVAVAVAALLLLGAAAAVAAVRAAGEDAGRRQERDTAQPDTARPGDTAQGGDAAQDGGTAKPRDLVAELTFEGIVLERHAVGVTVAYPRVRVTVEDGRATTAVELPTFNCLRDAAPADPAAAGCTRSIVEYAEPAVTDLTLRSDDDGFRISGDFPTARRPNGSPPVATGRAYAMVIDAGPRDGSAERGRQPATGSLRLGGDRVGTSDTGPNEITYAG